MQHQSHVHTGLQFNEFPLTEQLQMCCTTVSTFVIWSLSPQLQQDICVTDILETFKKENMNIYQLSAAVSHWD